MFYILNIGTSMLSFAHEGEYRVKVPVVAQTGTGGGSGGKLNHKEPTRYECCPSSSLSHTASLSRPSSSSLPSSLATCLLLPLQKWFPLVDQLHP